MPDDTLRLPVGSFEIIQRILAAYATLGQRGPVKLKDVAERTAMQATAVSGNHAFLESIGIIDGGKQKSLTELGRRVAVATTHAGTLEARNAWSMVVAASDHLQKIVDAVRIRQGMKEDALTTHIVVTAGVPKSTRALTGARTVLDLLREAGVIEEIDGTFRATASAYVLSDAEPVPSAPSTGSSIVTHNTLFRGFGAQVNITIQVGPDVLLSEEATNRLRELIKNITTSEE